MRLRESVCERNGSLCGEATRENIFALVPQQLTDCAHSKVLGVASATDGGYLACYAVDAEKMARGECKHQGQSVIELRCRAT